MSDQPAAAGPWTITIPAPAPWLSANDRDNRYARARKVKAWRVAAYVAALRARPPKGVDLVRVDVEFRFAGPAPVKEIENLRPTLKAVIDGAVGPARATAPGYGIVVDDTDIHLIYGGYTAAPLPTSRAGRLRLGDVVLTVTEVAR